MEFIYKTEHKECARFESANKVNPVQKFCFVFTIACDTDGLIHMICRGFKYSGIIFKLCYFKPDSSKII